MTHIRATACMLALASAAIVVGLAIRRDAPTYVGSVSALVESRNDFGCRLFRRLMRESSGDNLVLSPSSLASALSMLHEGAAGQTRSALAQALGIGALSQQDTRMQSAALAARQRLFGSGGTLDVANSVWVDVEFSPRSEFVSVCSDSYAGDVRTLDFGSSTAAESVNDWVREATHGKISSIVDNMGRDTAVLLASAVYFKGNWDIQFPAAATSLGRFHTDRDSDVQVRFMRNAGEYRYFGGRDLQAIELPYRGAKCSMFVFLPRSHSSLAKLADGLSSTSWRGWMQSLQRGRGTVVLPRFSVKCEAKDALMSALRDMGMGIVFAPGAADLSGLGSTPFGARLYARAVMQSVTIRVNEEGTEAAAVTTVDNPPVSVKKMAQPFSMVVDRPFLFAIRDNGTGLILFMGAISKPMENE